VKQLHAVARRFLPELARHTPLLPGADQAAYVDIDDTIRRTYGYAKQGAGYGYSKVKGLNALLGIVSTPLSAPVIAATRLRKGPSNSARGAAAFVAETIRTARACGASGLLVMRADSAFYSADVINACRALGARFSVTVRMNASVKAAIARIDEDAWTPIKYPKAVWDEEGQCWISDAEIAETAYTAFTSKPKRQQVTARLIVRRVKRLSAKGGVHHNRAMLSTAFDTGETSAYRGPREYVAACARRALATLVVGHRADYARALPAFQAAQSTFQSP
jgi:hypothetical protein